MNAAAAALVRITMPQLGETVTEGTVSAWLKGEGDEVAAGEPVVEISTDKVDMEIGAPATGVLRGPLAAIDAVVAVGEQLASIVVAAHPARDAGTTHQVIPVADRTVQPQAIRPPAASVSTRTAGPRQSPRVRRLLATHGLDSAALTGTGAAHRVTARDLETHLAIAHRAPREPESVPAVHRSATAAGAAGAAAVARIEIPLPLNALPPGGPPFVAHVAAAAVQAIGALVADGDRSEAAITLGVSVVTAEGQWSDALITSARDFTAQRLANDIAAGQGSELAPSLRVIDTTAFPRLRYTPATVEHVPTVVISDLGRRPDVVGNCGEAAIAIRQVYLLTAIWPDEPGLSSNPMLFLSQAAQRIRRDLSTPHDPELAAGTTPAIAPGGSR